MLNSLHIRNYILIDSLDISFPEGLVIITGQTGAGKSILLGALSLLSGIKADASMISEGADNCVVEAEFNVENPDLHSALDEADVDWNGGHIIIRRVLNSSGRSRSFVNDCPVPVSLLSDISSRLIDIHSQHKSLLLTDRNFQLSILDFFADNTACVAECRTVWNELRDARSRLDDLKKRRDALETESDYNNAQLRQLEGAKLRSGELEELEVEQKSLSSAEQIKEALERVDRCFNPDSQECSGIGALLKEAGRQLSFVQKYLPQAQELAVRVESARVDLEDVENEAARLNSRVDMSPEHLQQVEDRLSLLYTLLKKHSCATVDELIELRNKYASGVNDIASIQEAADALEKDIAGLEKKYELVCGRLHDRRVKAASGFASEIRDSLESLELDRSVFVVDVCPGGPGPSGKDSVVFRFSASGTSPVELERCASGGEVSRIMLCLKALMARFTGMPTMIFDEIDTGVSGSVADKMGRMICSMGTNMQVFSITHLPQVAAKGEAHYVVEKTIVSGKTVSSIRKLSGNERIREIARLLSGATVTDAAMANARELLKTD